MFFAIVAVIHDHRLLGPIRRVLEAPRHASTCDLHRQRRTVAGQLERVHRHRLHQRGDRRIEERRHRPFSVRRGGRRGQHGDKCTERSDAQCQAAFLFLLTSTLAALIHLSYMRMVVIALPYTVTMTITASLAVTYVL